MLAAVTTGSGNAPFYAFVEMIPKLAHSSGINPAYLTKVASTHGNISFKDVLLFHQEE